MSDAEAVLFCEAAFNGDLDGVRALLENSPALANATNIRGQTALLCAATSGQYTIVLYLISHPTVNVNVIDSGSTPLHAAAWNNHPEIVQLLLEHGASADLVNDRGETPSDNARSPEVKEVFRKWREKNQASVKTAASPPAPAPSIAITIDDPLISEEGREELSHHDNSELITNPAPLSASRASMPPPLDPSRRSRPSSRDIEDEEEETGGCKKCLKKRKGLAFLMWGCIVVCPLILMIIGIWFLPYRGDSLCGPIYSNLCPNSVSSYANYFFASFVAIGLLALVPCCGACWFHFFNTKRWLPAESMAGFCYFSAIVAVLCALGYAFQASPPYIAGHWVFLVASLLVIAVGVAFLVKRIKSRLALDNDHLNSDFEKSSNSSLPSNDDPMHHDDPAPRSSSERSCCDQFAFFYRRHTKDTMREDD